MPALDRRSLPNHQGPGTTLPLAALLAILLIPAVSVRAGSITLPASRDNTLFEDAQGDTSSGAGTGIFAGNNGQDRARRALVAFDLAGQLPADAMIDAVVLTLEMSSTSDSRPRDLSLHRVVGDWGEGASASAGGSGAPALPGDATWVHRFFPLLAWQQPGGDFEPMPSSILAIGDVGTYAWSHPQMARDVEGWLADAGTNHGWLIRGDESEPRTVRRFDSRESASLLHRPALTIFFSRPVPTRSTTWGDLKARYR